MNSRRLERAGLSDEAASTNGSTPHVPPRDAAGSNGSAPENAPARSREEAEARFTVAHDAWIAAMRLASSGKPADMATLAIAQAAYEAADAERQQWAGSRVAVPISSQNGHSGIDAVVGQELAWRRVRDAEHRRPGLMGRIARRIRGKRS